MVAKAESEKALRYSLAAGFMAPAHTCAGGKALLASLRDAELLRLYGDGPIECVTPKTIGTLDVLQADLALARTRGYAIDDEEWGIGLRAIAVPVRGPGGHVSFALSMCAPAARVDLDELLDGARPLHGGAQRLEVLFGAGYQPK
jgi:DNA-binding IclR family transcriptional regulator